MARVVTGAHELIAKARADAQDASRAIDSMLKKNFPASGSKPKKQHVRVCV